MNTIKSIFLFIAVILLQGCTNFLEEDVFDQLAPENFLTSKQGIESVLFSSYNYTIKDDGTMDNDRVAVTEMCTDILKQTGGAETDRAIPIINFSWDPTHGYLDRLYTHPYIAIRDANIVLENIDNVTDASIEEKNIIRSEARFLRAYNYYYMWDFFGPTPLRTSTQDSLEMARPSESELFQFIETELLDIINILPFPGTEAMYGRANKGTALALLTIFYLNTKQWEKCNQSAQNIIELNYYDLFPSYESLFAIENELNKEFIFVRPADSRSPQTGNVFFIVSAPSNFKHDPVTGITMQSNWRVAASNYQVYDSFIESFDPTDIRKTLFLTQYINNSDVLVHLLGNDASHCWKYRPDPNANVNDHGNDRPVIRYSDILLSKAEALNEINGPNQESINLINLVRERAKVTPLILTDFVNKEELRDHILMERGWEFYYEEKRRRDLIRHDKFIAYARNRGITHADSHHERYPIIQSAIDANALLVQNDGY